MGKANHIYNSFIAGEISPRAFGRVDATFYNQAAETVLNMIVFPQGGAMRRTGSLHKTIVYKTDNTAPDHVRLFPFKGSDGSFWQIIITDENVSNRVSLSAGASVRFAWQAIRCTDGAMENIFPITADPLTESVSDFDWVPTSGWWDLSALGVNLNEIQFCQAGDEMFFAHGKCRPFRIVYNPDNVGNTHTAAPPVIHTDLGPHWTNCAFTQIGIPDFRKIDAANTLFEINYDYTVVRQMPFQNFRTDAKFSVIVLTGIKGNGLAVNGTVQITLTGTAPDIIEFDATWIGRQIKFNKDASTFGVIVTDYVSPTVIKGIGLSSAAYDGEVFLAVATNLAVAKTYGYGTGATDDSSFELGYWNDVDGWPRSVCFFESRIIFAGSKKFPDTAWASELNDAFQLDSRGFEQDPSFGDVTATTAFSQNMKEASVTQTRWMVPGKTIIAGTDAAEFVIEGPDKSKTIALDNTSSSPESSIGSAPIQAFRYDNTTVFLQRDKKTLREMVFSLEEDSYNAISLSILAEHIVSQFGLERDLEGYVGAALPGAFVAMVKQDVPHGIIWCLDNNGCLIGLTRNRQQQIAAWHRHELAGGEGPLMTWTDDDGVVHTDESMGSGKGTVEYKPYIMSISCSKAFPIDDEEITGEPDDLWLAVRRQQGTQVGSDPEDSTWTDIVCIEVLAREWERSTINRGWFNDPYIIAPVYMDGSIYWDSRDDGSSGIIDFAHGSAGDTVTVIKDGYDLGEFILDSSKQIDISASLSADEIAQTDAELDRWKCIVGYNFVARLCPLVPEVQMRTPGSSLGHVRRVDRLTIYFLRSLGVRFGIKESTEEENTPLFAAEEIDFPTDQDDATAPQPLYTGEKQLDMPEGYERRPQILIESYRPFPCIIPYVIAHQTVAED